MIFVHMRLQLIWIESVLCQIEVVGVFLFWIVKFLGLFLSLKLQAGLIGIR